MQIVTNAVTGSVVFSQLMTAGTGSVVMNVMNTIQIVLLVRYCNVGYPLNVEEFFLVLSNNTGLIPNFFSYFSEDNPQYASEYYRFELYQDSKLFLDNAGDSVTSLVINIVVLIIVKALLCVLKRCNKSPGFMTRLLSKVLTIIEWNNTIGLMLGPQVDFVLAWAIQFNEPVFDAYGTFNFVAAIVVLVVNVFAYIAFARIIKKNKHYIQTQTQSIDASSTTTTVSQQPQNRHHKKYSILCGDYHQDSFGSTYFMFISYAKNTLFVLIVFFFPRAPFVQSYLLLTLSICSLILLVKLKPFESRASLINSIINEALACLTAALMCVFAVNKKKSCLTMEKFTIVGWVFIGSVLFSIASNLLLTLSTILTQLKELKQKLARRKRNKRKVSPQT